MENSHYVQNIIPADISAYMYKSRLEEHLKAMFHGEIIPVRHVERRFEFFAPRVVHQVGIFWLLASNLSR
ncbi:hypothetical protein BDV19DRAFT_336775 [Aspergillus venezuelensis]